MRMIIPRKMLFFLPNQLADKEHACMYERIVRDISLIFNEFKGASFAI